MSARLREPIQTNWGMFRQSHAAVETGVYPRSSRHTLCFTETLYMLYHSDATFGKRSTIKGIIMAKTAINYYGKLDTRWFIHKLPKNAKSPLKILIDTESLIDNDY